MLEPAGAGTKLTFRCRADSRGFFKLAEPLVIRLAKKQIETGGENLWAVLVLLVAVAGGAVLAAAAGARRTASAYSRFLTASRASDLLVAPNGSGLGGYFDARASR
jgi:hypothetical protein